MTAMRTKLPFDQNQPMVAIGVSKFDDARLLLNVACLSCNKVDTQVDDLK